MTQRKPPGTSFESWIDRQIEDARERGAFEHLPGHGEPLANLGEADDPLWWAKQLVRREGLSVLPASLEVRRLVERLWESLPKLRSERQVREALNAVNASIRKANRSAWQGPPTTQAPLDEEEMLARWREVREE